MNTEKIKWDGSFLVGGPELNVLQGALSPPCQRKVEWSSFPQTLKYRLIIKEGFWARYSKLDNGER